MSCPLKNTSVRVIGKVKTYVFTVDSDIVMSENIGFCLFYETYVFTVDSDIAVSENIGLGVGE